VSGNCGNQVFRWNILDVIFDDLHQLRLFISLAEVVQELTVMFNMAPVSANIALLHSTSKSIKPFSVSTLLMRAHNVYVHRIWSTVPTLLSHGSPPCCDHFSYATCQPSLARSVALRSNASDPKSATGCTPCKYVARAVISIGIHLSRCPFLFSLGRSRSACTCCTGFLVRISEVRCDPSPRLGNGYASTLTWGWL
jgi:hypothetical protein